MINHVYSRLEASGKLKFGPDISKTFSKTKCCINPFMGLKCSDKGPNKESCGMRSYDTELVDKDDTKDSNRNKGPGVC